MTKSQLHLSMFRRAATTARVASCHPCGCAVRLPGGIPSFSISMGARTACGRWVSSSAGGKPIKGVTPPPPPPPSGGGPPSSLGLPAALAALGSLGAIAVYWLGSQGAADASKGTKREPGVPSNAAAGRQLFQTTPLHRRATVTPVTPRHCTDDCRSCSGLQLLA
jgi:hypothetical protein